MNKYKSPFDPSLRMVINEMIADEYWQKMGFAPGTMGPLREKNLKNKNGYFFGIKYSSKKVRDDRK